MEGQNIYCFDYVATHSALPRHRTCCPFMQRTLYRIIRNIARLDLGFSCPSGNTPQPPASRKKRKGESTWKSFLHVRGTSGTADEATDSKQGSVDSDDESALYLPAAFSQPFPQEACEPDDEGLNGPLTEDVVALAQELDAGKQECELALAGAPENVCLKTKRGKLRRQKMREFNLPSELNEVSFT
ncbi:unnamed protein product [Dibothriocephalus latus]|uniref:Uncharacterized protein n=1 Tax=Dibothriocephalus latus TaxID=60516 RepID=A0A3P6TY34_DIBLA|nr:unnamed protein product [Dibothriocephalus latus]